MRFGDVLRCSNDIHQNWLCPIGCINTIVSGKALMRHRIIILMLLTFTGTSDVFGQKLKKAIFYLDGEEIKYNEFQKTLKENKFEQINTIPGTKETVEIFGERAKNGVVHLKTTKFIQQQDSLILILQNEFRSNGKETKMIVLNGVPFERSVELDKVVVDLDRRDIEWVFIAAKSDNLFHTIGQIKVIQTNKSMTVPSR